MKLSKIEREILAIPIKLLNPKVVGLIDGKSARKFGRIIGELNLRDNILITNDQKHKLSVIIDLRLLPSPDLDMYKLFTANGLRLKKSNFI